MSEENSSSPCMVGLKGSSQPGSRSCIAAYRPTIAASRVIILWKTCPGSSLRP